MEALRQFQNAAHDVDPAALGLPRDWNAPLCDLDNWPRLIQLAWLLYDEHEKPVRSHSAIIKPHGFAIPTDAVKVHAITTTRARSEGAELARVLKKFASAICSRAHQMSRTRQTPMFRRALGASLN